MWQFVQTYGIWIPLGIFLLRMLLPLMIPHTGHGDALAESGPSA